MNDPLAGLKALLALVGVPILYLLGGWDVGLQALLVLMVADWASGISKALIHKELDSSIAFRGALGKLLMLISVVVVTAIDRLFAVGLAGTPAVGIVQDVGFRSVVILYFCAGEGISFAENAAAAGVPLPKVLLDALKRLRGTENGGGIPKG